MNNVLYSYALDAEGKMQSIHDKDAPRPFQCGDCDGEMVAKRGKVRTWHYAHKPESTEESWNLCRSVGEGRGKVAVRV